MFKANSRTQGKSGIEFYEQDVIGSEYAFTGDIVIDLKLDYLYPGFGIILAEDNGKDFSSADHVYLYKIGYNDFSIIERHFLLQSDPAMTSCYFAPSSANLSANLLLKKTGKLVTLEHNRFNPNSGQYEIVELGRHELKNTLERYKLGFYSNAGNKILAAAIASGMPTNWLVNIKNTNGGRVNFYHNGFMIENCEYDAEIEQQGIVLPAGKYHLDYKKSAVNGVCDIDCFVFHSYDKSFDDLSKNILLGSEIVIDQESNLTIKFKGKNGSISEIALKDFVNESYVETGSEAITVEGSSIRIDLRDLSKVEWQGSIMDLPDYSDFTKPCPYAIVATASQRLTQMAALVELNKEYKYIYTTEDSILRIFFGVQELQTVVIDLQPEDENTLTVFENMTAEISELIVTYTNGTSINTLLQKTFKKYVPSSVKSPILVLTQDMQPLELSASYREVVAEDSSQQNTYLFTNYEREFFTEVHNKVYINSKVLDVSGALIVFGVTSGANYDLDSLLKIPSKLLINSIDLFADKYDILPESAYVYSPLTQEINILPEHRTKYELFVVDYLKAENYAINYIESYGQYEVDIATEEKELWLSYEMNSDGSISDYEITNIRPDKNKYVVLRKNGG